MPHLYRVDTGETIGEIDERLLDQLIEALEEEDSSDRDYFVDANTLEYLAGRAVDPDLLALLRGVIGDKGIDIRWAR
jgi:hypothetical protein